MTTWKAKRFWKDVTTAPVEGGHGVFLDGRPVRTPLKVALALPNPALAEAVAEEWRAVEEDIRPTEMPMTRSANAAIDKVVPQFDEVAAMIGDYGGSDLLCYRAESPEELCRRQTEGWDPLLDWAADTYGARLVPVAGIMPVTQDAQALKRLQDAVRAQSAFQLTALHDLVTITGSLVLGLAVTQRRIDADGAFALSRIDEDWQIEQWGEDEEATAFAMGKLDALRHADRLYHLSH